MLVPFSHDYSEPESYKDYKAKKFNKNLEKVRLLFSCIDQTSLKPEDKKKLKTKMLEMVKRNI